MQIHCTVVRTFDDMENSEIIPIFLAVVFLFLLWIQYLKYKNHLSLVSQEASQLRETSQILKAELEQEKQLSSSYNEQYQLQLQENQTIKSDLRHLRLKYEELLRDEEQQNQKFELIANRIIEQQSVSFDRHQTKGMQSLLNPLEEKLKSFEAKIERTHIDSIKRVESLKEQVKLVNEQSHKISADANNLAKALKGDFKQQGNWGEFVLESILDKSGLEKDREYFVQQTLRDDTGRMKKPDVIIHIPDGKRLIIDSKVSLVAYDRIIQAESESAAAGWYTAHTKAIKNHIDDLSQKAYHRLYQIESPDFVLMFIPIDTAFSVAIKQHPDLYQYAFEKDIVIVTPSTLLATLKTVESMWRNDKQNRHAVEIAQEAGKMYDKFVSFLEDVEKIGKQLNTVQNSYHDSYKKLHTGSGNLISRANKIKALGAKTTKQLNGSMVDMVES